MRFLVLIVFALALNSCATPVASKSTSVDSDKCLGSNTEPQFGYDPNHVVNRCDQAFIDDIDKKTGGHRDQAIRQILELGYSLLDKDPDRAIKRFNQAWLLDRFNPGTFQAFIDWETKMGNTKRADEFRDRKRMFEKL